VAVTGTGATTTTTLRSSSWGLKSVSITGKNYKSVLGFLRILNVGVGHYFIQINPKLFSIFGNISFGERLVFEL